MNASENPPPASAAHAEGLLYPLELVYECAGIVVPAVREVAPDEISAKCPANSPSVRPRTSGALRAGYRSCGTKMSRAGISTAGSVAAFMTASRAMMPFPARIQATRP